MNSKKGFVIFILAFAISFAVLAGTLASYTTTLDNFASGSVVAKEFIFMEDGTDSFQQNVKIAPTDTLNWSFGVRNYNGTFVTETDLYYNLVFTASATAGKQAIEPLVITVKNQQGDVVGTINGTGTVDVFDQFPLQSEGQRHGYTLEIHWPSNDEIDINYAGHNFGTTINVSAIASQVPFEGNGSGDDPGQGEPGQGDPAFATVTYSIVSRSVGNPPTHTFNITITNLSEETINGWELRLIYPGKIFEIWNAEYQELDGSTGLYSITNAVGYTNSIPPGESRTFGGRAEGDGYSEIESVTLNGRENINVVCIL